MTPDDAPVPPWLGPARLAFFTPVREYPPLADRKACALLAAFGLMTTVLITFSGRIAAIVRAEPAVPAAVIGVALVVLAGLVLAGSWLAFHALYLPIPPMPDSMAFYTHIAALPRDEYRRRVLALDGPLALRQMLHYNYALATLSVAKFRLLDYSVSCVRYTFGLWAVILVAMLLFDGRFTPPQ